VISLLVIAVVSQLPAALHGTVLAPFDMLSVFGLGHRAGVVPYNVVDSDLLQQDVPWMNLAWTQVHHGHLPLWDPYDGLGMPLGLDFITASFSLPTLVSYLVPMRFGLFVAVLVKLSIAGTGVYFLSRTLGLRYFCAAFAGMLFELSGAFTVWLGWSQSGVMEWLGWIIGATILILRGDHRTRNIILLAIFLSLSIYGGHPESNIISIVAVVTITAVILIRRLPILGGSGQLLQPILDMGMGSLAALGLSAPLWLPGVQLTAQTARFGSGGSSLLPLSYIGNFIFDGYDGFPVSVSHYFGASNYYEITSYVGISVLALAGIAMVRRWSTSVIQAFIVVIFVMGAIIFLPPAFYIVEHIPHASSVNWHRDLIPLSLSLAVLAGVGLNVILTTGNSKSTQRAMLAVFGLFALILVGIGIRTASTNANLPAGDAAIRDHSFIWPAIQLLIGFFITAVLMLLRRRAHRSKLATLGRSNISDRSPFIVVGALVLAISAIGFLIFSSGPLWSPNQHYFPLTSAEAALQSSVGSSTVGFGVCPGVTGFADLGILTNANIGYRVHEFAFYETAVAPKTYYQSWSSATGRTVKGTARGILCPAITSLALAKRYGVSFILEPAGTPGPAGTTLRMTLGDEDLYSVPDSGPATIAPARTADSSLGAGRLLKVSHPDTASWKMVTDARQPSVVFLRLTDVPGWRATLDGVPTVVQRWDSVMLKVQVPAGRHTLELNYWPSNFADGLLFALITICVLIAASFIGLFMRYRSRRSAIEIGVKP
jgi:hypothetical protein